MRDYLQDAHNRELIRAGAFPGNYGLVVAEDYITSKTPITRYPSSVLHSV